MLIVNNENENFDNVVSIESKLTARREYDTYLTERDNINELMHYLETDEYFEIIDCYNNGHFNQDEFGKVLVKYMAIATERKINQQGFSRII